MTFKRLLNLNNLTEFLPQRYHHILREAQGQEIFRFLNQNHKILDRIMALPKTSSITEMDNKERFIVEKVKDKMEEVLVLGHESQNKEYYEELRRLIEELAPWRKGPYRLNGNLIDSEWDSSIKWNRLLPYFRSFINKESMVADLGCNNGYFILRLLNELTPRAVIGFEPVHRNFLQYLLLQSVFPPHHLVHNQGIFLLLGYEFLRYFPRKFNVILCLGILYHHPNPLNILELIAKTLKPGGRILIDCQGVLGEEPFALFPEERYAGKRNFWFLPTSTALINWLKRIGFKDIEILGKYFLQKEEQRVTSLASGTSLAEGLVDSEAYFKEEVSSQTIEGYPTPVRVYLTAKV